MATRRERRRPAGEEVEVVVERNTRSTDLGRGEGGGRQEREGRVGGGEEEKDGRGSCEGGAGREGGEGRGERGDHVLA